MLFTGHLPEIKIKKSNTSANNDLFEIKVSFNPGLGGVSSAAREMHVHEHF